MLGSENVFNLNYTLNQKTTTIENVSFKKDDAIFEFSLFIPNNTESFNIKVID